MGTTLQNQQIPSTEPGSEEFLEWYEGAGLGQEQSFPFFQQTKQLEYNGYSNTIDHFINNLTENQIKIFSEGTSNGAKNGSLGQELFVDDGATQLFEQLVSNVQPYELSMTNANFLSLFEEVNENSNMSSLIDVDLSNVKDNMKMSKKKILKTKTSGGKKIASLRKHNEESCYRIPLVDIRDASQQQRTPSNKGSRDSEGKILLNAK